MNAAEHVVERFMEMLIRRGFITEMPVCVNGIITKNFHFGPLGSLLRRNILKQWWDSMLVQPNTFCIENNLLDLSTVRSAIMESNNGVLSTNGQAPLHRSLSHDFGPQYLSALKLCNHQLPLSLATSGHCVLSGTCGKRTTIENFLTNGVYEVQLLLEHYYPPESSFKALDFWLNNRLHWWKKYSTFPSKVTSSGVSCDDGCWAEGACEQAAINVSFPWGTESVETVSTRQHPVIDHRSAPKSVAVHRARHHHYHHQESVLPGRLECKTSLEQCMKVFLFDAHREQGFTNHSCQSLNNDGAVQILRLHPLLSPYFVASCASGPDHRQRELSLLAGHVTQRLRRAGLSVFYPAVFSPSPSADFHRNDEIGVPYTVVMREEALGTGIVSVRNRDTGVEQSQHVSQLESILLKTMSAWGMK